MSLGFWSFGSVGTDFVFRMRRRNTFDFDTLLSCFQDKYQSVNSGFLKCDPVLSSFFSILMVIILNTSFLVSVYGHIIVLKIIKEENSILK